MKLSLRFLLTSLASTFALAGCAADPTSLSEDDEPADIAVSQDALSTRARPFVGNFYWNEETSGAFVHFEELKLNADGSYSAKVDSALVDPSVQCVLFPCTLRETGTWMTATADGKVKIIVDPSGEKGPRSYYASIAGSTLKLTRLGQTTKLFKQPPVTCANVRCATGKHCEMKSDLPVCVL